MDRNDRNLSSDDSLDESIRDALRVDTDPRQLARLERYWHAHSQRHLRRRRAWRAIPLAAAAMAAVAVFVLARSGREGAETAQAIREPALPHEDSTPREQLLVDDAQATELSQVAGRAPTAYERFVFATRVGSQQAVPSKAVALDTAINQLVQDNISDAKQAFETSGLQPRDAEALLLRKLPRSTNVEQAAILRLLAVCGTERSVAPLLRLGRQESSRDDVLSTMEQIVGIEGLARTVGNTTDRQMRMALVRRVLTADSEQALLGYLSLVGDERTRGEALAIAEETPQLPIAHWLALLDHEEKKVRLSAAMVLGRVNGAEVTKSLIARVTEKPADSREAWMALLVCRGELAEEFLAYAAHRPQLLGHYNSARVQWARMIP